MTSSEAAQCSARNGALVLLHAQLANTHWAQWRNNGVGKVQRAPIAGAPEFQAKNKNNYPITVKIRTSGYQTVEFLLQYSQLMFKSYIFTVLSSLMWQFTTVYVVWASCARG